MYEAARLGDAIGHSGALSGMMAGTLVGAAVAAAGGVVSGVLLATGLAASCLGVGLVLVGAALALGWLSSELATSARDSIAVNGERRVRKRGVISSGSPNVLINGKSAALASLSQVQCDDDGHSMHMAEGAASVTINGQPASRINDRTSCDGRIIHGSANVLIGGPAVKTAEITPEVPEWLYQASDLTLLFSGLPCGGGAAASTGVLARALSKLPGISRLGRVLCRAGALMTSAAAAGIVARPVDIVSGQKFLAGDDELDFVLPSRLPVRWQRYWRSGNPGDSVLGRGWNLFWETRLQHYGNGLVWRSPCGDYLAFPLVPRGRRTYCSEEKYWLEHHHNDSWSLYDISGERWRFPPLPDGAPALPSCLTEPCGNAIEFVWNADNTLHALTDSAGQRVACRYQDQRLTGVWLDDEICLVSYHYNDQRQLVTVTGRGGRVRRRFAWQDGLMSAHQDASGLRCEYQWQEIEGLPRVVSFRHSAGEQLTIDYDFAAGTRRASRDDGAAAHWLIDDDDNVARFTDFDGRQSTLLYDNGELCDVILPGGAIRRSRWDRYGRMTEETDPAGRRTRYHWFRLTDRLSRSEYPDHTCGQNRYDLQGRLLSASDALNNTTTYHYPHEEETLPDCITDAAGGEVRLQWNRRGQLIQRSDCSGSVTRFGYDRLGQLVSSEDAEGHITHRVWNDAGQLCEIIYPDARRETFQWHAGDQLSRWRDASGSEMHWQWNASGQPLSQTDRNGHTRRWYYDARGNLLRLENGNGGAYRFSYDATGHLLSETRPDNTRRQQLWDERGFLSSVQEQGQPSSNGDIPSHSQHFSYDDSGQLIARRHLQAEYRYHYDQAGRLVRLQRMPTAAGNTLGIEADEVVFTLDAAGRLLGESAINGELAYQWDAIGNLTHLTLPGGQQLAWLYYGSGHASAIRFNQQLVSEFTRDRLHRETGRSQGARQQLRRYDSAGRRILQRSELSGATTLTHSGMAGTTAMPHADAAGPLSASDVTPPEKVLLARIFHYTDRNELARVSDTLRGEISYGHDAEGRLLSHSEARQGYRAQFCYDAADNLAAAAQSPPVSDNRLMHWQHLFMQYDGWGNLVSRRHGLHQQHFVYDAENRLISASGTGPLGDFTARYHYDALGRRTRKIVTSPHGSQETRFLWQGYRLLQEQQHNGLCSTYLYDPAEAWSPLARVDHTQQQQCGDLLWFSTDLNGAPLEVTDDEGDVCWSGQYGSFGAVSSQTDGYLRLMPHPALRHQPLRYAGQYADAETGLHYNLFRYYDPQVGRFITPDPIGLAGGLNLYAYAPNPLSWIDPWGLSGRKVYKDAPYHGATDNNVKSRAPLNGQAALDNSVQVKPTSPRRVGTDVPNNEIVVLDKTRTQPNGIEEYHGHVRDWDALDNKQQSALTKAGMTTRKGKICG